MSWYLDNVFDLNKELPYTFYVPSSEVLNKLNVGNLVKLIFVTDETEDDGYRGERKDILEKREFNFMLRDYPYDKRDSGWSILSGYEDDIFLSDAENYQIISIGVILNMEDSILEFIHEPPFCAYERNEKGKYKKVDDYDWKTYLNGF